MELHKGVSSRRTSGSGYANWVGNKRGRGRHGRAFFNDRSLAKQNPSIIPCLDFEPDIPEGFQAIDSFLQGFADRPELQKLLPEARQRIERARSKAANYRVTLASLRRSAGLSQKELAVRIGTVQPVISMYESGEREPSLKAIYSLAQALGVSFDDLLPALKND